MDDIARLRHLAEQIGWESYMLDDFVHDAYSQLASELNNQGMLEQLHFLVEQWGALEVENIIRNGQSSIT